MYPIKTAVFRCVLLMMFIANTTLTTNVLSSITRMDTYFFSLSYAGGMDSVCRILNRPISTLSWMAILWSFHGRREDRYVFGRLISDLWLGERTNIASQSGIVYVVFDHKTQNTI